MGASALIHFDSFHVDPDSGELCKNNKCLPLLPKDSAVLLCLLARPGKIVSKEILLEEVWQGTVVSDGVIKTCIKRLRQKLGDDSRKPIYIETVHRRGYRFIGRIVTDAAPPSLSPLREQPPSIVGRKTELDLLLEAYREAEGGKSRHLFITGEAGIGKSALVQQFEERLREQAQPLVARGSCVDTLGPGEAYAPLFEALEMMAGRVGPERFGDLMRRVAPMWLFHMPWLLKPGEARALARQLLGATAQRMFRELVMLLDAMAQEATVVLIIEDVHWADGATLDALMILINQLISRNIMVVATLRPEGATGSGLKKLQMEIVRHGHCKEIALSPLTEDEIDLYLSMRFAGKVRPMMLAAWLLQYTEGNPLFVKALLDHAGEKGWLRIEARVTWEEPASRDITWSVPNSLREFIRDKFDRMPAQFRDCLQIASVAGLSFQTRALCQDSIAEETAMDELFKKVSEDYRFIRPDGVATWPDGTQSPCYAFVHAWYRQVVYDQISLLRKRELHRFVGERLERIFGDICIKIASVLAIHFEKARDIFKAIQYRRMAGEAAMQRHAYQEVQGHMERGLALMGRIPAENKPTQQEVAFRILLGTALSITKGYSAHDVVENYSRARVLCRQTEGSTYLLPVYYGLWGYYLERSEFDAATDFLKRFEQAADRQGTKLDAAYAQFMATTHNFYQGKFIRARQYAENFLSCSAPGDADKILQIYGYDSWSGAFTHRGLANLCLGYPRQAAEDIDSALAFAEGLDLPTPLSAALACKIAFHLLAKDSDAVAGHVDRLIQLTERYSVEYWKYHGAIFKGYFEAVGGNPDSGIKLINSALKRYEESGAQITQPFFLFLFVDAYIQAGDFTGGLDCLKSIQKKFEANAARYLLAEFYRQKGDLLFAVSQTDAHSPGGLEEIATNYMIALDTARGQRAKLFELRAAVGLCRLRRLEDRPEDGRRILEEVYNWFEDGHETSDLIEARALLENPH